MNWYAEGFVELTEEERSELKGDIREVPRCEGRRFYWCRCGYESYTVRGGP